jgi:hypothetical protein
MLRFYGKEFLTACLTARLEDHCLLGAHNFLFNILTATQYMEATYIHNLKKCHAMVMDPLVMEVVTV